MTNPKLINSIKLQNFLSYGASEASIPLESLNVIIGANGSGKSNLLEAIDLLRSAPDQLQKSIREGGGVRDWLWKGGAGTPIASLDFVINYPKSGRDLRYHFKFTEEAQRFHLVDERIEDEKPVDDKHEHPYFYYRFDNGRPVLNVKDDSRSLHPRKLQPEDVEPDKSILAQRRDPEQYPEITWLGKELSRIRLYREWSFGRYTAPRVPQKSDLPTEMLEPDASNLGLVLNRLRRSPGAKQELLEALQKFYDGIEDYDIQIEGGTVQVFFQEGGHVIPATRLSDGTLRYLSLLAVLCHPEPPPLICIEEPELGLHPDILPTLAELLKKASHRTQLIVTTHSEGLINALSDQPDAVMVAEKVGYSTKLTRLDAVELQPWLEKYRLGQLWTRGDIGGTRW